LKGDLETVRTLLAADPSLLDAEKPPKQKTPLHYAAQGGHADVVEFLLDKGAQVNHPNIIGETPLHCAATAESPAGAILLAARGADLGARTQPRGATPLTLATAFGRLATMKMLLERGADPRQAAPSGETLLHVAAVAGPVESIPLLVAAGADVNAAKADGETPLLAACSAADLAKARALLKAGADPNRRDVVGREPLALAAGTGQTEFVTLLLEAGADARRPSAPGAVGALHAAAVMGYGRIVATLLASGADPGARDSKGRTAFDLARAKGHARLAVTLSEVTPERDRAEAGSARGARSREQTSVLPNSRVEERREAGAAGGGGSAPMNPLLTRPLGPGESIVWYLGHLGWAVRTAKHFLIFDYDGRLTTPPDEPSLASGWIVPAEIRDLPTTVFITHGHDDHYAPAVFDWKATVKDLTIVTGFEPEGKAGYVYIPPRESRTVGDLEITTIKAMDAGVGFHVRVDGISIFHSGDHDAAWEMPTFKPEIDFIADRGLRADLLFMPVQAGDIPILNDGLGYAIGRLSAGAFFPGHGRGREHVYLAVAEALRKAGVTTPIHCAEFGGDHFAPRMSRHP
jgi:cytohesin